MITPLRLDGQILGFQLTAPDLAVNVLSLNIVTGEITSAYLTSVDIGNLKYAVDELFALVPSAQRAAGALGMMTRLVTVSVADNKTVALTAIGGPTVYTLVATASAAPANFVVHLPFSPDGNLAWAAGSTTSGGGGGGAPSGPAGGVLGYTDPDGVSNPSTYPNPNGLAGTINGAATAYEIHVRNMGAVDGLPVEVRMPSAPQPAIQSDLLIASANGAAADAANAGSTPGRMTIASGTGGDAFAAAPATQSASPGGEIRVLAGVGGDGATDGAVSAQAGAGGNIAIAGGDGGPAPVGSTAAAGDGGGVGIYGGTGQPGAAWIGGNGGSVLLSSGPGGDAGTVVGANAGDGGTANVTASNGGNSVSGGGLAGDGGGINIFAGKGGDGAGGVFPAGRVGGPGGTVDVRAGDGGDAGGGAGGNGGDIFLRPGVTISPDPTSLDQNDGRVWTDGVQAWAPDTGKDLTALKQTIGWANKSVIFLTASGGNVIVNPSALVPPKITIENGTFDGEVITLINVDTAFTITFVGNDTGVGRDNNIALVTGSRTLQPNGGNLTLMWAGVGTPFNGTWIEINYSAGPLVL